MVGLTVQEAAEQTGWSPRMLRYIERTGLVVPPRSRSGYRLYGADEVQRLVSLRELLRCYRLSLEDVGFAHRMRRDPQLRTALDTWFAATPRRSEPAAIDWLRWEQEKHLRLLSVA
jgi:DNA-binding transcriptional MerR regulator